MSRGVHCFWHAMKALGSLGSVSPLMAASLVQSCQNENPAHRVSPMPDIINLDELAEIVPDGVRLGIGGVHLSRLPIALIKRVLANGRKDFVFISWGGGLPLELFLEANAVRKLIFCFSSLDIFGFAPNFGNPFENKKFKMKEWTPLALPKALQAANNICPKITFKLP